MFAGNVVSVYVDGAFCAAADLGSSATPQKSGYNFTLAAAAGAVAGPADCNAVVTSTGYYATAVPTGYGTTGSKSYATNAGNTVYQML